MNIDSLYVVNHNDFTHEDSYDGQLYSFPPEEPVLVPCDAARHMLGWDEADKTDTLVRLGWANKYDAEKKNFVPNPDGLKKLTNFTFEEAVVQPKSALQRAIEEPLV